MFKFIHGEDIPLGSFEQMVMTAIISLKENAYGVTIYEKLREMGKHRANWGAMYLTLKRLDKKEYIQSRTGEPTRARGGKSKKFFTLTDAGERALAATIKTYERCAEVFDEAGGRRRWPKLAK